mgnify:CR=1 FL=1
MKMRGTIEFAGLRFTLAEDLYDKYIESPKDTKKIEKLIGYIISGYRLDSFLLKIHNDFLDNKYSDYPPFIPAILTQYVVLNSRMYSESSYIPDEEFLELLRLIMEYAIYDPSLSKQDEIKPQDDSYASFLLKTVGTQSRWDRDIRYMLSRTSILYDDLINEGSAPKYIEDIINNKLKKISVCRLLTLLIWGLFYTRGLLGMEA